MTAVARRQALLFCALVVTGVSIAPAAAQDPPTRGGARRPFPIPPTTASIPLDGAIAESLRANALSLELLHEVRPGENTPPPVRTEMLLAHDDRNLYVAFRAHDDTPSLILYRQPVNRDSRDLLAQLLFSYKVNSQTALYFGYTSGVSGTDAFPLTHAAQTLFAKVSYAWLK